MTIDDSILDDLRTTLGADGYQLAVDRTGSGLRVQITAGPHACADCLVPKPLLRTMLHAQLGVPEDEITLVYPNDGAG